MMGVPADLERLNFLAREGDTVALRELVRHLGRRGDAATIRALAAFLGQGQTEEEGLRHLAWLLIEGGAEASVAVEGRRTLMISEDVRDIVAADVTHRRRLLAPVEVPLVWNAATARLFACDCAERALVHFETAWPRDRQPCEAISAARAYARREEISLARVREPLAARLGQLTRSGEMGASRAALHAVCATLESEASHALQAALAESLDAAEAAAFEAAFEAGLVREAVNLAVREATRIERAWQFRRLLQYLLDVVEPLPPLPPRDRSSTDAAGWG